LNLALTAQGKAVPGGRAENTAQAGSLTADLKAQTASLDGLALSAYGVQVHGAAQAAKLLDSPEARGVLEIPAFDLKKTLAALGQTAPETADPAALTRVAARAEVSYSPAAVKADNVHLDLDGQGVDLSAAATGLSGGGVPAYRFAARAESLDLDPYLSPKKAEAEKAAEPARTKTDDAQAAQSSSALAETLRKLELDGSVKLGRLKVSGAELTDVDVTVTAHGGVLTVEPLDLKLFGGSLDAAYRMDARPAQPASSLSLDLGGLQVGQAMQAFLGKAYITGLFRLATTEPLTFSGLDSKAILGTLGGKFNLGAENGSLPAGGTAAKILEVASTVLLTTGTITRGAETLAFDTLQATGDIRNGVLHNGLMLLKSPALWAQGGGDIDLAAKTLDYLVGAKLVSNPDPKQTYDQVQAPEVEVAVNGALSEPSIKTNLLKSVGKVVTGAVGGIVKGAGQGAGGA
ncbi:MAG: AsmA-like C-terminal region-containing protein, partial [Desulfovibrionaceae bacterium]